MQTEGLRIKPCQQGTMSFWPCFPELKFGPGKGRCCKEWIEEMRLCPTEAVVEDSDHLVTRSSPSGRTPGKHLPGSALAEVGFSQTISSLFASSAPFSLLPSLSLFPLSPSLLLLSLPSFLFVLSPGTIIVRLIGLVGVSDSLCF